MIGLFAGGTNIGSDNIFLGCHAGYFEQGDNKLYIENSNSTLPLIYGEFDNDFLRINGTLNVNNAFSFPTADGTSGQVLQTEKLLDEDKHHAKRHELCFQSESCKAG